MSLFIKKPLAQLMAQAEGSVELRRTLGPANLVALVHPSEYPYNEGRIVSTDGLDIPVDRWDDAFEEVHVEGTNALQARTRDFRTVLVPGDEALIGTYHTVELTGTTGSTFTGAFVRERAALVNGVQPLESGLLTSAPFLIATRAASWKRSRATTGTSRIIWWRR